MQGMDSLFKGRYYSGYKLAHFKFKQLDEKTFITNNIGVSVNEEEGENYPLHKICSIHQK